jgi:hypothetical protein
MLQAEGHGLSPNEITECFNSRNPSGHTTALKFTELLREVSREDTSVGKEQLACKSDSLTTTIYEPTV